ncbi:MAG: LamG domain-containing protein, partial [Planctomycetota bacterium]
MTTTREQFTACIIIIITVLLCTPPGYGQVDPKSVVAYWLFDEASGSAAADSSGHGYDADLKQNPAWVDGKFGHALEFKNGNYLEIRNSSRNLPFGGATPFTITAWVKNQGGGTVIGKFNGGVIGAYILAVNGSGTVTFHREVDPWTFDGTLALPDNEFGHIAATYDGTDMKIYVNGEYDSSQPRGPQNTDTVTPVLIGARFTNNVPSDFFSGVLDEVALFNTALTEQQIRDVMYGLSFPK